MLCLRDVPSTGITCAGYVAEDSFELRLGNLRRLPRQVHEQLFAHDKRTVLHRATSVFNIPILMKLFGRQVFVLIAEMTVFQRLGRIAMYPAIVGQRQVPIDVPLGPRHMIWKYFNHAKHCGQAALCMIESVTSFIEQVADYVTAPQARRKLACSAKAGYGRERMLQVGLATDRAVDKRRNIKSSARVTPRFAGNKRDIRVQVKDRHAIYCKRLSVTNEKTPALAGVEQKT